MKHKFILILILSLFVGSFLYAQNKRDYNWLFGKSKPQGTTEIWGNLIDFNNNGQVDTLLLGAPFTENNAIISDKEGNLLFYSNGCKIINADHELMENGDSINSGETWEEFCKFNNQGYPGYQNSIILPDPGNGFNGKEGYYLIHKRYTLIFEPIIQAYIPELLYSYIDLSENGGKGKVIKKNIPIFSSENFPVSFLTACRHKNNIDWWVIEHKKAENLNYIVLLNSDSIALIDSINIGLEINVNSGHGQATFTPDGSKYLLYTSNVGALIYDFNRETGRLSNFKQVAVQDSGRFVGIAISPNSRYAYLSSLADLYQIDLWAADIQGSLTYIDHIDGFTDPTFLSTFNHAQLAPDCKIYIVSGSTNNYLHVINKPNEKGKACDFRQHSLYLPKRNFNNCIPNFPHFRMDEEEVCDPTITSMFGDAVWYRRDLEVYPNPSSGVFHLKLAGNQVGELLVLNLQGQVIFKKEIDSAILETSIDISHAPAGYYHLEFYPEDRSERIFYGVPVVKE